MALVIAKTLVVIGHFPIGTKVEVIEEEMDLRTKKQYSLVVPLGTSKQIRVESKHIFYTYVKRGKHGRFNISSRGDETS